MELPRIVQTEEKAEVRKDLKAEIKEMMLLFDRGNGSLSTQVIKPILNALGRLPSPDELKDIKDKYCPDGTVTFPVMVEIVRAWDDAHRVNEDNLIKEAFNVFDYNGDGSIVSKDLFHIITRIGGANKLNKEEASQIVDEFDVDGKIKKCDISDVLVAILNQSAVPILK